MAKEKKLTIVMKRRKDLETKDWEVRYEYLHRCPPHIWSYENRHWICAFCPQIQHEKPEGDFITKDEVEFVKKES